MRMPACSSLNRIGETHAGFRQRGQADTPPLFTVQTPIPSTSDIVAILPLQRRARVLHLSTYS